MIGPNGAGKTTFFNLISGFFAPTVGHASCSTGRTSPRCRRIERVALGMARTFQITEIFPELTVRENVRIAAEVAAGLSAAPVAQRAPRRRELRRRVDGDARRWPGLTGKADRLVGELAHGDQRAAEIVMALALQAAPAAARRADRRHGRSGDLRDHPARSAGCTSDEQATIVLIEHDMRVVFHLADRIMVLDRGRVARRGHAAGDRRQRGGAGRLSGQGRMSAALEAEGLHTYYGKSHILHGVGLEVAEGEITALLGRNGAGKTTTLRSLMGLTPPREGPRHDLRHATTTRWPPYRIAALGVGYVPEGRRIFPNLTVDENLQGAAGARRARGRSQRIYRAVSAACRAQAPTAAGSCPAASRRCWRSPARCCSIRSC